MINLNSRKGFFFVLATLIVLSYILTSITLWTKSMEAAERAYAERFKLSNLELATSQVSPEKLREFASISVYHALYTINDYSVAHPIAQGSGTLVEINAHINNAFASMVSEGKIYENDLDGFAGSNLVAFADKPEDDRSFSTWFSMLNESVHQAGLEIRTSSVKNFKIEEVKYDDLVPETIGTLHYSFDVYVVFADKDVAPGAVSNAGLIRNEHVEGYISIEGMDDPAVMRTTDGVQKQFYFASSSYTAPQELTPVQIATASEGQSWFYGPAIMVADVITNAPKKDLRKNFILVGTYNDITSLLANGDPDSPSWDEFGAYILTEAPPLAPSSSCPIDQQSGFVFNPVTCDINGKTIWFGSPTMLKPYIVADKFDIAKITEHSYSDPMDPTVTSSFKERRALIVSPYSYAQINSQPDLKFAVEPRVYDMENLRDSAVCGYYMHNSDAPSYFQRLFAGSTYTSKDANAGIETFVFGSWTDGNYPHFANAEDLSKLDREFFQNLGGNKVRGMPGCKNEVMCGGPEKSPVGYFILGDSALDYLLDKNSNKADPYLLCKDSGCRSVN